MTNYSSRFCNLFFNSDLHATRFTLAIAEIIWAVTLFWPGDTFIRPIYSEMSRLASEELWGFVFVCSSLIQFYIIIDGRYHTRFATFFAGWNFSLWLYVTISMYMSVYPPPAAISGETALTLAAGWVWVRSGYVSTGRRSTDYQ